VKIINIKHYPDASRWTIEEVVQFISSVGFKEHADAFKEQVTAIHLLSMCLINTTIIR